METKTYRNVVDGKLAGSGETFTSINPATDEVLGSVPVSTPEQIREAVAAAKAAQPAWAALPDEERKGLMMQVAKVLEAAQGAVGAPVSISGFVRFGLGEGIERREDDFAAEVAKLTG